MTTSAHTSFASEPPFLVPCPPPALRLPPHVFRTPPAVQRSGSKSIPLPPIGARIPGDRIVWTLRVLAGAIAPLIRHVAYHLPSDLDPEQVLALFALGAAVVCFIIAGRLTNTASAAQWDKKPG